MVNKGIARLFLYFVVFEVMKVHGGWMQYPPKQQVNSLGF